MTLKKIQDKFVIRDPNPSKPLLVFVMTNSVVCLSRQISKAI